MIISGRSEIILFVLDAARSLGYEDLREQEKGCHSRIFGGERCIRSSTYWLWYKLMLCVLSWSFRLHMKQQDRQKVCSNHHITPSIYHKSHKMTNVWLLP